MQTSRRGDVDPFIVMDVVAEARRLEESGREIAHMEVGQPGTPAPKGAREALARTMERDALGYSVTPGLPALRQGIAALYRERHGVDLDPGRVIVTSGSSGAFVLAFTALFDVGARVAMGDPGYPSYRQILKALSLEPVSIPTGPETRYQPTPEMLSGDLDGLIVASPANPTGTILDRAELGALADAVAGQGGTLISDEIYHGIDYGRPPVSALEITDEVCVINSFSKYYSMTGWRVGWMVVPEGMVRPIERLAQNMFICAPHAAQVAALAALECREELEANLAVYAANRALMLERLPAMGFDRIAPPDGAFYVYADVSAHTSDSHAFAREILHEAGVAVTPGLDFDPARGHATLRFSYAAGTGEIAAGLDRLAAFMAARA